MSVLFCNPSWEGLGRGSVLPCYNFAEEFIQDTDGGLR